MSQANQVKYLKLIWGKIRLTVIIILSITIGASYAIAIPQYLEVRKAADDTWTHVQQIQEQRVENKSVDDSVQGLANPKTESIVQSEAASEDRIAEASPSGIEEKIKTTFKDDYETALAVAKAESGLKENAQGFNCRYNGISQSCRKGDEHKAWSTDCGIYQHNVPGKTCPTNLFDPDENIQLAFEKYQKRKWQPWSAFKSGAYLAFIN